MRRVDSPAWDNTLPPRVAPPGESARRGRARDLVTEIPLKYSTRLYWTVTGLMAGFMLMASIPDILRIPQAVEVFTHLGYPTYLLPFIGLAKMLGVIAVLAPGFWRLKEWAYAGLVFDLIGALYSHLAVGDPPSAWGFPIIGLTLVVGSYLLHRTRLTHEGISVSSASGSRSHAELAREVSAR